MRQEFQEEKKKSRI